MPDSNDITANRSLTRPPNREILQNYLDDIFDTPVLETQEQNALFLGMEEAEAGLRAALARLRRRKPTVPPPAADYDAIVGT